ncbi:MAG: toxin-antitoxin system HicB family antitoxin, partial [Deltaproteobacteria bacterium]|nr:toxin-antitoxin system HicB family antitoxin [Deltaproteobacteria bacterium]
VTWLDEDQEYVGLCAEFPSLSHLAASPEAALRGIRKLVAAVIRDMRRDNETIPEPIASRRFSGRLLVRLPPETHRHLTLQAAEAGVSINRLVSAKLER